MSRNKMCYLVLALSIGFFLSSVCTYAVLAMTKQNNTQVKVVNKKSKNNQGKILKRLKRLEDRMNKRSIKIMQRGNND
jgi:ABC-type nickel/cobalt efflux system permease component RcnA